MYNLPVPRKAGSIETKQSGQEFSSRKAGLKYTSSAKLQKLSQKWDQKAINIVFFHIVGTVIYGEAAVGEMAPESPEADHSAATEAVTPAEKRMAATAGLHGLFIKGSI